MQRKAKGRGVLNAQQISCPASGTDSAGAQGNSTAQPQPVHVRLDASQQFLHCMNRPNDLPRLYPLAQRCAAKHLILQGLARPGGSPLAYSAVAICRVERGLTTPASLQSKHVDT